MKRLAFVAAFAAALLGSWAAQAAGTIPFSLSQQFDADGQPLTGCNLYFFAAGTSTPQSAYYDTDLTIAAPNPIQCDASGRLPQFFLADGSIKVRLADKNGVTVLAVDNILVIGPSSGGGGGGGVDATTVLATGDIKVKYGTGALTGFVRLNGRTIGSATSGATERANADTQALFEYLWNTDSTLTVSTGRGASATADWSANKTIALPDARGRIIASLDDMGSTSSGRLTSATITGSTTLGSAGGAQTQALTIAQLPVHTPAGSIVITDPGHTHGSNAPSGLSGGNTGQFGGSGFWLAGNAGSATINSATTGITAAFNGTSIGSGDAHPILPPVILMTTYIKL